MSSNSKLIKRLILPLIGIYLALKFSGMVIPRSNGYISYLYTVEFIMLRLIICSIAFVYYLHLQEKKRTNALIELSTNPYRVAIGTILVQLMMSVALLLLSSIKDELWGPSFQPILDFSGRTDFLCRRFIEIICIAAILEELVFRGIIEKLLSKITSRRLSITLINAVMFSLMHANISNNLFYFVMGCFLSHLYYQTKNIIYPIVAHALHNLCALLISYFGLEKRIDLAIDSLPMVIRIVIVIAIILAVYGYVTYRLVGKKTK